MRTGRGSSLKPGTDVRVRKEEDSLNKYHVADTAFQTSTLVRPHKSNTRSSSAKEALRMTLLALILPHRFIFAPLQNFLLAKRSGPNVFESDHDVL